jgi:hypothetical protein
VYASFEALKEKLPDLSIKMTEIKLKKILAVLLAVHHIKSFSRLQDFQLTDQKLKDAQGFNHVGV